MVGSVQTVLVKGPSRKDPNEPSGEAQDMRPVDFAAAPRQFAPRLVGQFVDVLITEAMSNSLRGRVASLEAA